jgi:hypothetical protein
VAKEGDGWLTREIGGYVGRWTAKQGEQWVSRDMDG